ncbi:MAG TPA: hypothetical protein VHX13_06105 [Acidobacteriaceae bacterium]|jgi:hypothetical protein|nr:hypothetical protein [Acidobacteriaceae bacterium]
MKRPLNAVVIVGLMLGGILGMAGTFVGDPRLRTVFWGIDGLGLIVATAILSLKNFRSGNDAVAAGFLLFCIGESVMLGGTPQTLEAMVPSFAAGVALWAAALLMTGIPPRFALWARVASVIAAIVFLITFGEILWGVRILPTAFPLPGLGFPFLVLAFCGWIRALVREP